MTGLVATLGSGAMTNPILDLVNSKCIFIIGSNFAENHPIAARWVLDAKEHGAKIIVADPRYTPTAWIADIYSFNLSRELTSPYSTVCYTP